MIGLLQRVSRASVECAGAEIARIGPGLLVFVGIERADDDARADRLLERLLGYRVFPDDSGRMNRSLRDVDGGLLLVPQFTLAVYATSGKCGTPSSPPAPSRTDRVSRPETGGHPR